MKELVRYLKKIGMILLLSPMKLLKTNPKQILLENCLAHNFADNIKPIAIKLSQYNKFRIYIAVLDEEKYQFLISNGIIPVKVKSFKYYFIAMTSGCFITNSGGYSYLPLKNNQRVINTWHGGGAYKKIGIDAFNTTNFYKKELKLAAKKTSIFLATGSRFADLISKALLIERKVFAEVGMPRNDILVNNDDVTIENIKRKIGLSGNEKMVLYAPTYRRINSDTFGQSIAIEYGIDTERVCDALSRRFGGKWKFAVRLHPQIKNENSEFKKPNIINLTNYEDMQELLLVADVMINDFSSSMWDFMLTGKPSFLYAKDLQNYIDTTAVYTPVEEWPFPKSTTNDELEKSILEFDEYKYKLDCERHYKALGGCETGKATEFVCNYIIEHLD